MIRELVGGLKKLAASRMAEHDAATRGYWTDSRPSSRRSTTIEVSLTVASLEATMA
jgi:hypothetical protein